MNVGIVGHEGAKFGPLAQRVARRIIRELLAPPDAVLVSGHCHLGGIDIWAEEEWVKLGRPIAAAIIHKPKRLTWADGFRERNKAIARDSDIVHCLVVDRLPLTYRGMEFGLCYHCGRKDHVKSGGCWTAKRAKAAEWHIIAQDEALLLAGRAAP